MIVSKAVAMAQMMDVPVLGLVENMSYLECPDCGKKIYLYGESHVDEVAQKYHIPVLGKMPIDPAIAANCDKGLIELVEAPWLEVAADAVEAAVPKHGRVE